MSLRNLGFVAAMEDDVLEVDITNNAEVPAEVEAEFAETTREGDAIVDDVQAMEDAVEDVRTLTEIADVSETAADDGEGMDPVSAEIAEIAVEAIYNRLGIKSAKAIPSLESFGSTGSRKAATRIAIEDWKENIKKAWDAVVRFLKNIAEKVKAFFLHVLDFFKSLEKAAESMKKRAQELKGEAEKKEFEDKTIAMGLGAGSGKATASSALSVLAGSKSGLTTQSEYAAVADETVGMALSLIGSVDKLKDKSEEELYSDIASKIKAVKGEKTGNLFNNNKVEYEVSDDNKKISLIVKEDKGTEGTTVATLTKQEMVRICDEVIDLAKAVNASKKIIPAMEKATNGASKIAQSVVSSISGKEEADKELRKKVNILAGLVTRQGSQTVRLAQTLTNLATKAGKTSLNYVASSLKQYKEAVPAAK